MSFFLCVFSCEVMIRGIRTNYSTPEYNVSENTMNSNWVPKCGMNYMPDIS